MPDDAARDRGRLVGSDRDTALQMIAAGADRIGASASIKILRERSAPSA